MHTADVAQLLTALAAVIAAAGPIYLASRQRDNKDNKVGSWFSGSRGLAHYAAWAAGFAFFIAFAIIIYGLGAPSPVMTSITITHYRVIAGFLGVIGIGAGLGGVLRASGSANEGTAIKIISGAGAIGGLAVLGGMLVIAP